MAKFKNFRSCFPVAILAMVGVFLLPGLEVRADVPEAQQHEVAHLLDFISHSGCRMVRNGTAHEAPEAVKHIQRKYDYYREDIKTTEDFIDKSASRSTISGRAYTVECPGQTARPVAEWLKEELNHYRSRGGGA